ncbi:MAG: aldo/keto reductase [Gemmatimonadaceae bacterium]|nr:aldo/keto reductase [Gemmatimonadaceae bacterium]
MSLTSYRTLGRSGLKVSPLALGTMTFGTDWGWGSDESAARAIFDRYVDAGGNFVDTADLYVGGRSEEMLGRFIADRKLRDRIVLATKFSYNAEAGNPNAGGNGRKNIHRAVEGSLARLGTDYIDLLWLHTWDVHTPVEEVVRSLDALVRAGTVRYIGLSDVPAWYLTRYNTIAELQGFERVIALQPEYSLVERTIEREHVPAARELGVGITPWSPLASGFLTGKYVRGAANTGRLETVKDWGNPAFDKLTDRNWAILEVVRAVAAEQERSLAQVALAWVTQQPGITSTLVGATKLAQLDDNLGALEVVFTDDQRARLDAVSALERVHPYVFFEPFLQGMVNGNVPVSGFAR